MRQHLVMGNWKLNGTKASVEALIKGLTPAAAAHPSVQVAVCPPVIFLGLVEQLTAGSKIAYGAQNADVHESGAFTGENAPSMLKAFGCTYSLVGHSERRTLHAENDDVVAAKYEAIQKGGKKLASPDEMAEFLAGEGVDKDKFLATFNSFAIQGQIKQAKELAQKYGVQGVPTMIVNGKYRFDLGTTGGPEATLNVADQLIAKERAAK